MHHIRNIAYHLQLKDLIGFHGKYISLTWVSRIIFSFIKWGLPSLKLMKLSWNETYTVPMCSHLFCVSPFMRVLWQGKFTSSWSALKLPQYTAWWWRMRKNTGTESWICGSDPIIDPKDHRPLWRWTLSEVKCDLIARWNATKGRPIVSEQIPPLRTCFFSLRHRKATLSFSAI